MILQGDARRIPLADESVQCVVTSPPYWGLRDYGLPPLVWGGEARCEHEWGDEVPGDPRGGSGPNAKEAYAKADSEDEGKSRYARQVARGNFCSLCSAWRGSLGLEPTPELYVQHLVAVFREVRRVLRKDGTCWVNLGDSYASDTKWGGNTGGKHVKTLHGKPGGMGREKRDTGLKSKDLVGIPWRVAFALQADGWWLRSDIIWAKPNPMPESVTDRPTRSHEYVFLLTKSERYYYDAEAIREVLSDGPLGGRQLADRKGEKAPRSKDYHNGMKQRMSGRPCPPNRNRRSVWTIATQPYPEAHFATFPEALVTPCILAGTSELGACATCGAPWKRTTEKSGGTTGKSWHNHQDDAIRGQRGNDAGDRTAKNAYESGDYKVKTVGWQPGCKCKATVIPCIVLDPFCGSGTVEAVAYKLGRKGIGMDLKAEYNALAKQRARKTPVGLPL